MGMGRAAGWVSGLAGVPLVAWVKVLDEPGGGGAAWAARARGAAGMTPWDDQDGPRNP